MMRSLPWFPTPILILSLLLVVAPLGATEEKLSSPGAKLLKHAIALGGKRSPTKYDRSRFEKLLEAAPREELLVVARRLSELPKRTPAHLALAERISGRYWEAMYPGSSAIPGFSEGLAAKDAAARGMLLRAALTIEDLTTARKLAIETAGWEDPEARLAAVGALVALLDLRASDEASDAVLLGLLKDADPVVRCTAAKGLDEAARKEALDAYASGLEDAASRVVEREGSRTTFCFGSQAFYRLAELSRQHDAMDYEEYRGLEPDARAAIALDLVAWWKKAREGFSFHDSKWERFAATPVVHERVIEVSRPKDAYFRFRSPHDRSMVTIELTHLEFVPGRGEAWTWEVDWRLGIGIAGRRGGYETIEARHVPVNRRHGQPKQGVGRVMVAVQRIGKDRARVVVRFADCLGKR